MEAREFIEQAIAEVCALPDMEARGGWEKLDEALLSRSFALATRATGELHFFSVAEDPYQAGEFCLTPKKPIPLEASVLARKFWVDIKGNADPDRARAIIAVACLEFARSQVYHALFGIAFSGAEDVAQWVRERGERMPEMMLGRPWRDADAIARSPESSDLFRQTAALEFCDWVQGIDKEMYAKRGLPAITPEPDGYQLCKAIALVWLDEALQSPDKTLRLLPLVAECSDNASSNSAWLWLEKYSKKGARSFAQAGARARHAKNRAKREEVLRQYREGNWRSKDSAAELLAQRHGVAFRTAREWLKGA